MKIKVLLVNGSPRKNGNTQAALDTVAAQLVANGIEVEHIQIGNMRLWGCQACSGCEKTRDGRCAYGESDGMNELLGKVWASDGLVIGSPTYFGSLTSATKSFIDRCGYVCRVTDRNLLRGKVGAAVAVHRRAGALNVYQQINLLFGIGEMPIASSSYWSMACARVPGEYEQDAEGVQTMEVLGDNMAKMLIELRGGDRA